MRPYLRSLCLLALAGGALLLGESAASAQYYYGPAYGPPPPPAPAPVPRYYAAPAPRYSPAPSYYSAPFVHQGLFLRLTVGAGFLTASETVNGATLSYSGFGATLSGALGGAIAPNLIIYGEILGTSVFNADQTYGGQPQGLSGLDVAMYGFGPGIAFYIEPVNMYLSGTLTFSKVSFTDTYSQYPTGDTNLGIGGSFTVGKEWWVAQRLGMGIAGQAFVASMTDPEYNTRLSAVAISMLFSLTFN
jgi:hypothetical protein